MFKIILISHPEVNVVSQLGCDPCVNIFCGMGSNFYKLFCALDE